MMADFETNSGDDASPGAGECVTAAPGRGPAERDLIQAALDATAARYRACGRHHHGYARCKLRLDPVHRAVMSLAAREPFGDVVDVGCGRGQLGIALLEAGLARAVVGLDLHAAHLAAAGRAAAGLRFTTSTQDLAEGAGSLAADTILVVDVLYQLDDTAQERLLQAAAQAARRRIVLRLHDPARRLRSALTKGAEQVLRALAPRAGRCVNPWPLTRIAAIIEPSGYDITITPCWRGTPFANVLLIARRRG